MDYGQSVSIYGKNMEIWTRITRKTDQKSKVDVIVDQPNVHILSIIHIMDTQSIFFFKKNMILRQNYQILLVYILVLQLTTSILILSLVQSNSVKILVQNKIRGNVRRK